MKSIAIFRLFFPLIMAVIALSLLISFSTYWGGGIVFILAYFMGAVPFGLLLAYGFRLGDLRAIGSGNIGATNVLRTGNRLAALLTLFFDGLKGFLPTFIALNIDSDLGAIAFLGALIGHCFPIWLNFRGGKGVATFFGGLFAMSGILGLVACLIWLIVAFITRYSSLAALVMVLIINIIIALFWTEFALYTIIAGLVIFFQHRQNIQRLLKGEESRIGKKSTEGASTSQD